MKVYQELSKAIDESYSINETLYEHSRLMITHISNNIIHTFPDITGNTYIHTKSIRNKITLVTSEYVGNRFIEFHINIVPDLIEGFTLNIASVYTNKSKLNENKYYDVVNEIKAKFTSMLNQEMRF